MSVIGNNVIVIDGTGNAISDTIRVNAFLGIANADNPSCVITDQDGTVVYQVESSVANKRYFPLHVGGTSVKGLNSDIFTNMAKVIVYLK